MMIENHRPPSYSRWRFVAIRALLFLFILGVPLGRFGTASAATIGFGGALAGPFTTHSEAGFTVVGLSERWTVLTGFGNPPPFIQFSRAAGEGMIVASIDVTAGGSLFTFSSVDFYSSVTPIPFVITGFLSSAVAFTLSGTLPNPMGTFRTLISPPAPSMEPIDTLRITLVNPVVLIGNPMGLDNIVVTQVPEPQTLSLFASGLGAFVAIYRRRRADGARKADTTPASSCDH